MPRMLSAHMHQYLLGRTVRQLSEPVAEGCSTSAQPSGFRNGHQHASHGPFSRCDSHEGLICELISGTPHGGGYERATDSDDDASDMDRRCKRGGLNGRNPAVTINLMQLR